MIQHPVECPACDGHGVHYNNGEIGSPMNVECEACAGEGWREATADEMAEMAEAAHERAMSDGPDLGIWTRLEAWRLKR